MIIFVLIWLIVLIVFNFKWIKGKLQTFTLISNSVLLTLLVFIVVVYAFNEFNIKQLQKDYVLTRGGILTTTSYKETKCGYHIINNSALFNSTTIIVPEKVPIRPITKIYSQIVICQEKDYKSNFDTVVEIDGKKYHIEPQVVKIEPDFFSLCLSWGLIVLSIVAVLNLVLFIVVIIKLIIQKRQKKLE